MTNTEMYRIIDGADQTIGYYDPADGSVEFLGTNDEAAISATEGEVLGATRDKPLGMSMITLCVEIGIIAVAGVVWISWFIHAERNKLFNTEE